MIHRTYDDIHDDVRFAGAPTLPIGLKYQLHTVEHSGLLGLRVRHARTHVRIVRPAGGRPPANDEVVADVFVDAVDQLTGRPTAILKNSTHAAMAREAALQLEQPQPTPARTTQRNLERV